MAFAADFRTTVGSTVTMETKTAEAPTLAGADRRRHVRYRFMQRVFIRNGHDRHKYEAMTFEISESGLSVVTTMDLAPGDEVVLSPVAEQEVKAVVRRRVGAMYGFEFIGDNPKLGGEIQKLCEGLLPFKSMAEI